MKSTIRTLFLLSALLFSACEKDDSIFTELSIRFVMPDSRPVERLEILTDISYFYNLNTYERTAFPETEERNRTTVRLRRGVYNFIVEARATYADGTTRRLYCADHANDRAKAVTWVNGQESAVLLLQANR